MRVYVALWKQNIEESFVLLLMDYIGFFYPYFHAFMLIIDLSDHLSDDAIDPLFF